MTGRTLIAGIGNVFLGDDGFGVEVVRRLAAVELPRGVEVVDYGIRGVHLAYDLLDGRYGTLIVVDAVPFVDGPPGTVAVYEIGSAQCPAPGAGHAPDATSVVDGHAMSPDAVLDTLSSLGGEVDRILVAGCRPQSFDGGMRLSPAVAAAVPDAVDLLARLVSRLAADGVGSADSEAVRAGA